MPNLPIHQDCCGCTACFSVCAFNAIQMTADSEGFLYPVVNAENCKECKLCERVCPIIKRDSTKCQKSYKNLYAGRLKDSKLLHLSSSGGAFYALAKYTIESDGVVWGAEYTSDCEVIHGIASTIEECSKFRGSKYVQSNIVGIYPKIKGILKKGQLVLFSGTPCQVAGLKSYLQKEYENLLTVDIVCHAVPSPLLFKEYKEYVEKKLNKKLIAINMRDKEVREWLEPFSNRFIFENGAEMVDPKGIVGWNNIFFTRTIDRPSCHRCRFSNLEREGDFTIADFWDYTNKRPDLRDNRGTSLVIVNTEKGCLITDYIRTFFDLYPISEEEALQRNLKEPTPEGENRAAFWSYYYKYGFKKAYNKYYVPGLSELLKKVKTVVKALLRKLHII